MSKFEGNFAGKNIIPYRSRGGKQYSPNDIEQFLRRFKLCTALRLIGKLSGRILTSRKGTLFIRNFPVSNGILAYLSMKLIENSNDYRSQDMTIDDLLKAIDMFFGLPDPFESDKENPQGCLIRFGSSQLDYDREVHHILPRTIIIYRDLWDTVVNSNKVNIANAIQEISGLNLKEIFVLSFAFTEKSKKGFFHLYEHEGYFEPLKKYFSPDKQQAFADWISCSYSEFRRLSRSDNLPTIDYDKFRFNPLHLKPAIIPDRNLRPGYSQVYITPIPSLVYERVTRGLYFNLADHFRKENHNPFRAAFGSVFQEYVGLLLKNTFGESNVKREWEYGSKNNSKATPDWFVIQNNIAVLIEVKQSGLYLESKKWGEVEKIQEDLLKSIGAGVEQMWKFENDIANDLYTFPSWFNGIQITERLVVTYDRSYFLNSLLKDEIRQLYPHVEENYHWHTIAIEELEYFLGIVGTNFIEALAEKRLDVEGVEMDFRDYYARKYSADDIKNPYLSHVYDEFFGELGFPPTEVEEEQL